MGFWDDFQLVSTSTGQPAGTRKNGITYEKFVAEFLVEDLRDKFGKPMHTRFVKKYFYRFANQLKRDYGLDMFTCQDCGINSLSDNIIMELDHLNGITNDSRIENFAIRCPNCHQRTSNYKNRSKPIDKLIEEFYSLQRDDNGSLAYV